MKLFIYRAVRLAQPLLGLLLVSATTVLAAGPDPILLWPDGAPGARGTEPQDKPELRIYLPATKRATGAGVVICPGGGYGALATDHEGHQVARWFNSIGVAGFVLKYRHAPRYQHPVPLQDAQRAIRHVRARAEELNLSPRRIGIMGFSAGGHLASTAATHFDEGDATSSDAMDRVGCRPDFAVLGYPVISLQEPFAHTGSRRNLLGESPDPELVHSLSNETQVNEHTPPTFLFHTGEDPGVSVENSLAFYRACVRAKVPAELHVYQFGPHGVGLAPGDPVSGTWKDRLADWLKASAFLTERKRAAVDGTIRVDSNPLRWGMVTFVPEDAEHMPVAFALVSNGRFSIPVLRGAALGLCRIEVWDLGAVEPRPTIEDAQRLDKGDLSCEVKAEKNTIVVELATKP